MKFEEVQATVKPGTTWLNNVWGVLVLEVRELAPAELAKRYERVGEYYSKHFGKMPHAYCLVLYDQDGCWMEGSTLWMDFAYLLSHCNPVP